MKKVILGFAAIAMFALVACNKGKEEAKTEEGTKVEATSDVEVPKFDNEKLADYMELYDSYIEEYKKVAESKDMTKFQALGTKGQELANKAQTLMTEGLSASDTKKLNDYLQEKAKELQELTQKMMK